VIRQAYDKHTHSSLTPPETAATLFAINTILANLEKL